MPLNGSFSPAGDKSVSHRIALFSLLASGRSEIENYSPGADCCSSLQAVRDLGCIVSQREGKLIIEGAAGELTEAGEIDCGNSGTTIRLLMGILAGIPGNYTLDGDQYLRKRPMKRISEPLMQMGAQITTTDNTCPVQIEGRKLQGIQYTLPVASAQLKSALLLAGLIASTPTTIFEPVRSRDHTELMLYSFGADINCEGPRITLKPSKIKLPEKFYVPGDPSSAAFFLCAAALIPGSKVTAKGILLNPTRAHFLKVLERMGVEVLVKQTSVVPEPWGDISVAYTPGLKATTITADEVPLLVDEVPILALVAALAKGKTTFCKVNELRIKETDRLLAIQKELGKMGAKIEIHEEDGDSDLVVTGIDSLAAPASLDSYGDHRMAMMLRLALLAGGHDCGISEEECVSVSYPAFHEDLARLAQ